MEIGGVLLTALLVTVRAQIKLGRICLNELASLGSKYVLDFGSSALGCHIIPKVNYFPLKEQFTWEVIMHYEMEHFSGVVCDWPTMLE